MTRGVKRKYEPTLAMLMSSVPPYPGPRTLADMVWDRHFGEPLKRVQRWYRSRARRARAWQLRQLAMLGFDDLHVDDDLRMAYQRPRQFTGKRWWR